MKTRTLLIAAALLALAAPPADAATRKCGNVTVRFQPEGEGSAVRIRATRISCTRARTVARECLYGRRHGWRYADVGSGTPDARVAMVKGDARVTFALAGGGGCSPGGGSAGGRHAEA